MELDGADEACASASCEIGCCKGNQDAAVQECLKSQKDIVEEDSCCGRASFARHHLREDTCHSPEKDSHVDDYTSDKLVNVTASLDTNTRSSLAEGRSPCCEEKGCENDEGGEEVAESEGCCGGSCCSDDAQSMISQDVSASKKPSSLGCKEACCDDEQKPPANACCGDGGGECDGRKEKGCCEESSLSEKAHVAGNRRYNSKTSLGKSRPSPANEVMCPCCVKTLLASSQDVFDTLISRVADAQDELRRCCLAFARACCASSKIQISSSDCCSSGCQDHEGASLLRNTSVFSEIQDVPAAVLPTYGSTGETAKTSRAYGKERVTLEVIGMDCPDCLNKVYKAVKKLNGVEVLNGDGVRGLVDVTYDPEITNLQSIRAFASRASGFTINLLDLADDGQPGLILPLRFTQLPPQQILDQYDVRNIRKVSRMWRRRSRGSRRPNELEPKHETNSFEIDFHLRISRASAPRPREILGAFVQYGVSLGPRKQDDDQVRITRDLVAIALRTCIALVFTIPILVLAWSTRTLLSTIAARSVQLGLASALMVVAYPIYSGSFRSAWYLHQADLGVLTSFSTMSSYLFSVVVFGFQAAGHDIGDSFFETVGLLITLILAGRTLQASMRQLGMRAIGSLGKLQPEEAKLLQCDDSEQLIDVRLLQYDDVLRVCAGEIVPTDGVILRGQATIDESALTGEPIPVDKSSGSTVSSGSQIVNGEIDIIVTHLVPDNFISSIMKAVQQAQSSGSTYQELADTMAGWLLFVAGLCCFSALIGWMLYGRYKGNQNWARAVTTAWGYAIAIAAVACPCALAISVNLVTSVSMAMSVKEGILFRSNQALLQIQAVKAFAFDKTGTLSQGIMSIALSNYEKTPLSIQIIHAITSQSMHPASETVRRHIEELDTYDPASRVQLDNVHVIAGSGLVGEFCGYPIRAGNAKHTQIEGHPLVEEYHQQGMSILAVTIGHQLIALFGMQDRPRKGANGLMTALKRSGIETALISGDNPLAVESFARQIGLPPASVYAAQTPASKAEVLGSLQTRHHPGPVSFVGDGINDTIALSAADISIAIGAACNASSSIVMLSNDVPQSIRDVMQISTLTRMHVIGSLACCALYFTAAILLASGVTGWAIPPRYAGLGELASLVPVFLVSVNYAMWRNLQKRGFLEPVTAW